MDKSLAKNTWHDWLIMFPSQWKESGSAKEKIMGLLKTNTNKYLQTVAYQKSALRWKEIKQWFKKIKCAWIFQKITWSKSKACWKKKSWWKVS